MRTATDLAPRAMKVTASSLGQVMSTFVVQECHLWLNLADIRESDRIQFLNSPATQAGFFGDTVENFDQQFSVTQKQSEAIKQILPRRSCLSHLSLLISSTPVGTSVVPLTPLDRFLGAWVELPRPSCWLIRMVMRFSWWAWMLLSCTRRS